MHMYVVVPANFVVLNA